MRSLLLLAPFLAACHTSSAETPCSEPRGRYLLHWEEVEGGTCGPVPDFVVDTTVDDSSCTVDKRYRSLTICSDEIWVHCKNGMRSSSRCLWSKDAASAACRFKQSWRGCTSFYDVTYKRVR